MIVLNLYLYSDGFLYIRKNVSKRIFPELCNARFMMFKK